MKKRLAIGVTKAIQTTSKLMGKGGSTTPGHIGRKIDKDLLKKVRKNVEKVIFISGTNGKTTTSQVLASILTQDGQKIVHNMEGANMVSGITTAFVSAQNITGNKKYKYAVIEIDEGSIKRVFDEIIPNYFVFTNFFRDQLDRFGEIDMLVNKIKMLVDKKDIELILNGDDPYTRRLGGEEKTTFYGLENDSFVFGKQNTSESTYCPICGKKLVYKHVHYGQLGDYKCSWCVFEKPKLDYKGSKIKSNENITIRINGFDYITNITGDYNSYNITAAVTVALKMGISPETIQKGISRLDVKNGRMEKFHYGDKKIVLNLAKNPAGFNVSLDTMKKQLEKKALAIFLNDTEHDGIDISWIWDADFEQIKEMNIEHVYCGGTRAEELALRLHYAGFDEDKITIEKNEEKLVNKAINENQIIFMIPNYTMLAPVRKNIVKKVGQK